MATPVREYLRENEVFLKIFWGIAHGPRYYRFMQKTRHKKSHASVPLKLGPGRYPACIYTLVPQATETQLQPFFFVCPFTRVCTVTSDVFVISLA